MKLYLALLRYPGFSPFLWTQFLGAFNDNVFKIVISMLAIRSMGSQSGAYLSLIGAIFMLPWFFFSGYAGYLADRLNKRTILISMKAFELVVMVLAYFSFLSGQILWMLVVLFLMALQSTFFSPAKYGILPEMLPDTELSRANGLVEMSTFLAIILGTSFGGFMFSVWKDHLDPIGTVLIGVAATGYVTSFWIGRVPMPGRIPRFNPNPWGEIAQGLQRLFKNRMIWSTVCGIAYFGFLGAFLQMVFLLFGSEIMHLDEFSISLLGTFLAVGVGIGSLLAGRLSGDKVELGLVPLGSIGMGIFALWLAASGESFFQVALMLTLLGCMGGLFSVPLYAYLQQKSAKGERGQFIGTSNFMQTLGILSASGFLWILHDFFRFRPDEIIGILGLFTLVVTPYILKILPQYLIRFSLWMLTHTIYKIRIHGQKHVPFRGPALLVCNDVSFVDGLLVGACVQRFIRFLVDKDFFRIKGLGRLLRIMKAIPVGGRSREATLAAMKQGREALDQGHVVCIFAEGAMSQTGHLRPFKKDFEDMVSGMDVPIIPVHLDGVWGSIFSFQRGPYFWKWPFKIPFPVSVSFGAPLPATATAYEVRQAVMELGSDVVRHRRTKNDLLHLKFMRTAKSAWRQPCMIDARGKVLRFGQVLVLALLFSKKIRRHCANEKIVGLMLPSSVNGAIANIGVLLAGKVPVNLNLSANKAETDFAVRACKIRTILSSKSFLERAKIERRSEMCDIEDFFQGFTALQKMKTALPVFSLPAFAVQALFCAEKQDQDDLATIMFSESREEVPKAVMLSHHNILSNVEALAQVSWVNRKDKILSLFPFADPLGFTVTLCFPLIVGFGAIYHDDASDTKKICDLIAKEQGSILIGTPSFYEDCLLHCPKQVFASLRYAVVKTENLKKGVADDFRAKYGIDLLEAYSCPELSSVLSLNVHDVEAGESVHRGHVSETVGHPLPGITVKVLHPETALPLEIGAAGVLWVKGPNVMLGYLNQPDKTAEVIREGWYNTGEIAALDENGFIRMIDRMPRAGTIAEMEGIGDFKE